MLLRKMFQRKWLFATLLVLAGTALCVRLGIWQLDRLQQRRAFNAQFESARAEPVLDLNQELPEDLPEMEWRPVKVTGEYDFVNQIALRNQYNGDQYGYHLLTPSFSALRHFPRLQAKLRLCSLTAVGFQRMAIPILLIGASMMSWGRYMFSDKSGSGKRDQPLVGLPTYYLELVQSLTFGIMLI